MSTEIPTTGPHLVEKEIHVIVCQKCGNTWEPRYHKMPTVCPKCKNRKYWLPKKPGVGRPKGSKNKKPADGSGDVILDQCT